MTEEIMREGGCGCGAVRYSVRGDPIFVNNCYCRQCQRQTGSTSVVNAFFETEALTLMSGELAAHTVTAGSGGAHVIMRCTACGTALWSHYPGMGELGAGLRVSTLDDSAAFRPDAVIFVSERMPWVALPDGIPPFEKNYSARKLLPQPRVERLVALVRRKAAEA